MIMTPIEDDDLGFDQVVYDADGSDSSEFDIDSIDFSDFSGVDAKKAINKINKQIDKKKAKKRSKPVKRFRKAKPKSTAEVITPEGKKVNVKDVSKIIIGNSEANKLNRDFGIINGEKLKLLIFTFDNSNSAIDFNFSLFDPSQPLDYFIATGQDINSKILVAGAAGGNIQYSDVLFNVLANPTLIYQAKFTFAGALSQQQALEPLQVVNKDIDGKFVIQPIQTLNLLDTFQVQGDIVNFDIQQRLPYTFIPDGMDVLNYKVLPNMTVTFAFAYKQISIKEKMFNKQIKKDNSFNFQ